MDKGGSCNALWLAVGGSSELHYVQINGHHATIFSERRYSIPKFLNFFTRNWSIVLYRTFMHESFCASCVFHVTVSDTDIYKKLNFVWHNIIEYTCEAKNRRYNEIHYVPLSQYMYWKGQLRHIICFLELPFTLLILLLRQCGFVEFSGKIRQSNSWCKVHIGFILNQRKIFYFLGQNYRYIFSFEFLTWRGLCVLYDTMLRNFVCWRPARNHKAILFTIFSSSCSAFFSFSFLFFFFCRFLKNSPSRFIKVLKKVLMEIGFLYVSTDK